MEYGVILEFISVVGFPIFMCCAMMWYIRDVTNKHKEETEKFTDALNKNTLVLQKLCDTIGVERGDENE